MENKTCMMIIASLAILLLVVGFFGVKYYSQISDLKNENVLFKTLMYADGALTLNSAENGADALNLYDEASNENYHFFKLN